MSDKEDFLVKIGWEGGITAALDYGLTVSDYDLPEDMAAEWMALRERYAEVAAKMDEWAKRHADGYDFG